MAKSKKSIWAIVGGVIGLLAIIGASIGIATAVKQSKCKHVWNDGEVKVEATCAEEGKLVFKCEECGKRETESIEKLAHTWKFVEAELPTCTEDGHTEYTYCEVCEAYKNDVEPQVLLAEGHTEITLDAVAATCMEAGLKAGKYCTTCEEITVEQKIIPALGHKIVKVAAKEPTCTQPGNTAGQKCSTCDMVYVGCEEIPLIGHIEDGADGCSRCGESFSLVKLEEGTVCYFDQSENEYGFNDFDRENIVIKVANGGSMTVLTTLGETLVLTAEGMKLDGDVITPINNYEGITMITNEKEGSIYYYISADFVWRQLECVDSEVYIKE